MKSGLFLSNVSHVGPNAAEGRTLALRDGLILLFVLCAGAALRLMPVGYGLPFFYHSDETSLIFNLGRFLEALSRGATTIGTSTFYYPLMVVYAVYFAYGRASGRFGSLEDFKSAMVLDEPTLHLLGQLLSAAFSVAALIAVYALGRRLYGRRGGLIAVALMSVSVIDVSSSHWLKFDSAVVFVSLVSLLAILGLKDRPLSSRQYIIAGSTVGLAVAGRIDLLVLVPLLIIAHVLFSRAFTISGAVRAAVQRPLLMALGVAAAVYLLVSFALVNVALQYLVGAPSPFTTREMGASLVQFLLVGDILASVRHNIPFYVSTVLIGTCGVLLTAAIGLGIAHAVRVRRTDEVVLLVFVGLVTVPMLVFNVYGTHYFLRVLPVLMVLTAGGLTWLCGRFEQSGSRRVWVVAALVALVAAEPAFYSIEYVYYLRTNTDTRTRAREWLHREVAFGDAIAAQKFHELPAYLPPLSESREQIERKLAVVRADGRSSGIAFAAKLDQPVREDTYRIVNLSGSSIWAAGGAGLENLYDFEALKKDGVKVVITSGFSNLLPVNDDGSPIGILIAPGAISADQVARYRVFNERLSREASLAAEFVARDARIARRTDAPIDPTIRVYRLVP